MKQKLKYFLFLFRWFLIGRYFCDMPKWCMKNLTFKVINRVLWIIIIFSVVFTTSAFINSIYN